MQNPCTQQQQQQKKLYIRQIMCEEDKRKDKKENGKKYLKAGRAKNTNYSQTSSWTTITTQNQN